MTKLSVMFKAIVFALLIALVFASFPTANVVAKGTNNDLENQWDRLVTNYNRQAINHHSAHNWVADWYVNNPKASDTKIAEIEKHLSICNSALSSAGSIVARHTGFNAKGKVVDRAAAVKSIKALSYYLQVHAGSVKNLKHHL